MRKRKWLLFLYLVSLCCIVVNYTSVGCEAGQNIMSNLEELLFVPQHSLLIAYCMSTPHGSIRLWSLENGKLLQSIDVGEFAMGTSLAVSNDGSMFAFTTLLSGEVRCYSIKEKGGCGRSSWPLKRCAILNWCLHPMTKGLLPWALTLS